MHQILARGEALPIAAQFQCMSAEIVGDVAQRIVRVIRNQAMEAVFSAETNHFLVVVLDALRDLCARQPVVSGCSSWPHTEVWGLALQPESCQESLAVGRELMNCAKPRGKSSPGQLLSVPFRLQIKTATLSETR